MTEHDAPARPVHQPRACAVEDLFTHEPLTPEQEGIIQGYRDYLKDFAAPVVVEGKRFCHNCGGEFNGLLSTLGLTSHVAFEWGLTHGEGRCSGCGWPMRGHHYAKTETGEQLFTLRNFPLAYMPEHVERRG